MDFVGLKRIISDLFSGVKAHRLTGEGSKSKNELLRMYRQTGARQGRGAVSQAHRQVQIHTGYRFRAA